MPEPVFQREFERRPRAGMVGVGHHSYRTLLSTMHCLPVQLKAVSAHSDEARARRTAEEYGCRHQMSPAAMYEKQEPDAVFVCVAPEQHPDLVCEAFEAGLHVRLEKPPAMRTEGVQRMLDRRGDRIAVVGFKKAFMRGSLEFALELMKVYEAGLTSGGRTVEIQ